MTRTILSAFMLVPCVAIGQTQPVRIDPSSTPPPPAGTPPVGGAQPQGEIAAEGERGISFSFMASGSYSMPAEFGTMGDLSIARGAAELAVTVPITPEEISLQFAVMNEWSSYDFDSARPDHQVGLLRLSTNLQWKLDETWGLVGGFDIEAAGETDADFGESLTYGGYVGARYEVSPTFNFTFGAFAKSQLEDDAMILPLIGFEWKFADQWAASMQGPSARLTYSPMEELDLSLLASFENRAYRLSDEAGPLRDAVLRDERINVGLQAQWSPKPWFSLTAEVGAALMSEIKFDDTGGNRIFKEEGDPAGYFGLSATFRF